MRFVAPIIVVALWVGGCGPRDAVAIDREALRAVVLPDLSRLETSVQIQLRERHALLDAKLGDRAVPAADLGAAFGEMGVLLTAAGFNAPAEAALLNARALAPADVRWPYYLGHVYRTKGDIPKAMAAFQEGVMSFPDDVPTLIALGETELDQGRPSDADRLFAAALSLQPRSAAAHYGLGRAALATRDYARAAEQLEQTLALDSRASIVHYSLAMAYRGLGDQRRADAQLRQRGDVPIQPDSMRKALEGVLESALGYERTADAAGIRGDWAAAAEYLAKAVALAPTRPSPRHKLGTALFYLGDRRGALEHFQEAVRLSPNFAQAHYALGVLHEEAGDHAQAIESFSAAVKSEPVYVDARLGLADALRRSGQLEPALSEYERILKIDPSGIRARFGHAAALVRLDRYREAVHELSDAMGLYPDETAFARAAARLLAAAPDDDVRDGSRALAIGRALLNQQAVTIELAETMAMASAEVGQFAEAERWQRLALGAAQQGGRAAALARLADNLARYQTGRPCRIPWRADEPIEFNAGAGSGAGQPG